VFFVNSGAEANENALKIARKATGKRKFVSFIGGWHGRSILGLSVTDDPKIRAGYEDLLAPAEMLPWNDLAALDAADFSDVAGVILEPVQSMAGIVAATKPFLQALRRKCDASGTVLIFDEIQTGFGRLGTPFASGHFDVDPDITTVAKGIASGVPMGAVILNEALATGIKSGDLGSTFGGGPIACAALLATLEVLEAEQLAARAGIAEQKIRLGLAGSVVSSVRGAGLLLGLHVGDHAAALKKQLLEDRILVGGSHNPEVLRLLPPLTLSDDGIAEFLASVNAFSAGLAS
jgi:acetylornithine/succinyldiaminopimelate/putrescine aminotransferase